MSASSVSPSRAGERLSETQYENSRETLLSVHSTQRQRARCHFVGDLLHGNLPTVTQLSLY